MSLSARLESPLVLSAKLIGAPGREATHDSFDLTESSGVFTLTHRPVAGSLVLFVNGLFTRPGGYSVMEQTLSFHAHALMAGDTLDVLYLPS